MTAVLLAMSSLDPSSWEGAGVGAGGCRRRPRIALQ